MKKYEMIKVGDKAELKHTVTQSDIDHFVALTGDDNKLHVDKEYARRTLFKKPVVHGMLGASFISTVIGTKLPGDGALWFSQNLEFLLPVRVGDTITVKVEVINKDERAYTIELTTDIFNQNNQKVTTGTAKVKITEEESISPKSNDVININRVALVIGGTGGIGRAACLQLAKDGFNVAIHYHKNKESAGIIQRQIAELGRKAIIVNADITELNQVQTMIDDIIKRFDVITAVVNCATTNIPNIKFKDMEWDAIQKHFDISIKGAFNVIKSIIPVMEKNKYGKIVHITTQAIEKPNAEWVHYITSKSALHGFTKALAFESAPKGIRINLVSPSMTNTELIADLPEKVKLLNAAQTPLRRIAEPEDIAGAISFLVSEKSDFLTGETIRVNGGQVML